MNTHLHRVTEEDLMLAAKQARDSNGITSELPEDDAATGFLNDLLWAGAWALGGLLALLFAAAGIAHYAGWLK